MPCVYNSEIKFFKEKKTMKKYPTFSMTVFLVALLMLSACVSNSNNLAGTSWKLASYGPVSAPIPAAPGVETMLTFGTDGKLSGNLGCNIMGGDYKVNNQNIVFGSVYGTEMACLDESGMSQESFAFQVLQGTVGFQINSNTLTITSANGNNVLIFTEITKP